MYSERQCYIPMLRGQGHLAAVVNLPARTPCDGVVCCHGMLSSKESRKFAAIAEALNQAGLGVVRFDFSGIGQSSPPPLAELVPSRLSDLNAVIDHVINESWVSGRIGLLGSSLGGYLALLAAARRSEIEATVCWATPYDLRRIQAALRDREGLGTRFPPGFQVGKPLDLEDLSYPRNVLLIHGQQDESVPWEDAERIYHRLGEGGRLVLFEQADHRFLDPSCRQLAIRASVDWFLDGFVKSP